MLLLTTVSGNVFVVTAWSTGAGTTPKEAVTGSFAPGLKAMTGVFTAAQRVDPAGTDPVGAVLEARGVAPCPQVVRRGVHDGRLDEQW